MVDESESGAYSDLTRGYLVALDETFDGEQLDLGTWLPYYLPQWAGRERSRASHRLVGGHLELFIGDDQAPWIPEIFGDMRVSSLQTGCFAGPVGSTLGQHRTDDRLFVVEDQPVERLVTPHRGAIEMRARWSAVPDQMVALWMIGFEDEPERSAEICVCEMFGNEARSASALVGMGVHPFNDPNIVDDFDKIEAHIDVSDWHDYGVVWTADSVTFFIDDVATKRVEQSPRYPMQLMVNIYDFAKPAPGRDASPFQIDRIRVLKPSDQTER